jgi:hypothetical protein
MRVERDVGKASRFALREEAKRDASPTPLFPVSGMRKTPAVEIHSRIYIELLVYVHSS